MLVANWFSPLFSLCAAIQAQRCHNFYWIEPSFHLEWNSPLVAYKWASEKMLIEAVMVPWAPVWSRWFTTYIKKKHAVRGIIDEGHAALHPQLIFAERWRTGEALGDTHVGYIQQTYNHITQLERSIVFIAWVHHAHAKNTYRVCGQGERDIKVLQCSERKSEYCPIFISPATYWSIYYDKFTMSVPQSPQYCLQL